MSDEYSQLKIELKKLQDELDKRNSENLTKSSVGNILKDTLKELPGRAIRGVSRSGKIIAKAVTAPANLPTLGYNLGAYFHGKPENMVEYPSEKVGTFIDKITGGLSKPRTKFEEDSEPYIEMAAGMLTGGSYGKMIEKAAKYAAEKGINILPKILNRTGKIIGSGSEFNLPTVATNAGALYGAKKSSEIYKDNPIVAPLIGSVLGATIGKGGYHVGHFVNPKSWSKSLEEAAIRHSTIGDKFIKQTPMRYNFDNMMNIKHSDVGENIQKGVNQYKNKASSLWNRTESKLIKEADKDKFVNLKPVFSSIIEKFNSLDDISLKNEFLLSPVGSELKRLMKLPKSIEAPDFIKLLSNKELLSKHLDTPYSVKDALHLRRSIDNDISKKGFLPIGKYDEVDLSNVRSNLKDILSDKFNSLGEIPGSQWKRYMQELSKFQEIRKGKINDILQNRYEPAKSYKAAVSDLGDYAYTPGFVGKTLKGKDREKFGESLLKDLGENGENFDLSKLVNNFSNLKPEAKKVVLSNLSPQKKVDFLRQKDIYHGINEIKNKENNFIDALLRTPGLSIRKALLKTRTKNSLGRKFSTPEGIERLESRALGALSPEKITSKIPSVFTRSINTPPSSFVNNEDTERSALLREARDLGIDFSKT